MNKKSQDKRTKDIVWDALTRIAQEYAQKYMNPHQTIIIDQTGIELLDGEKASPFKLLD